MLHQTKGIVLNRVQYGETSLIVHVYTEKFGRQSYMVKGGRSKKSKSKSNLFRPFFLLDMEVYHREGKNIQSLKEARISETLNRLIFDVRKSTLALFLTEVLSKVLREEEANPDLFVFLYNSIRYLDLTDESVDLFHLYFLSKLSRFLGFFPQMNWSAENCIFDMDNGRFVAQVNSHAHCLGKEESEILFALFNTSIDQLNSLKISKKHVGVILRGLLNFYALQSQGFTSLKSLAVIEELFNHD
ncbi:DNA repair protein RecO [Marinifilum caeruleilacunae]|uniref:DNA repair protein RecO n=1 Tax=Marinifilum caeruleilacunae TaxID=2499076 RepID=A0ABX1WUX8_9BACT|nr:DNA repair protein RecO [Marinifilum caeruleilacunae]NOU59909.1 DNA repair protein RecO [Marinifilum caeruleilacunae]